MEYLSIPIGSGPWLRPPKCSLLTASSAFLREVYFLTAKDSKVSQGGARDFDLPCFWRRPEFPICISSAKNRNRCSRFLPRVAYLTRGYPYLIPMGSFVANVCVPTNIFINFSSFSSPSPQTFSFRIIHSLIFILFLLCSLGWIYFNC